MGPPGQGWLWSSSPPCDTGRRQPGCRHRLSRARTNRSSAAPGRYPAVAGGGPSPGRSSRSCAHPWGRRRLAYPIQKKEEGVYHLVSFTSEAETLDELSRVLKIDDDVLRHMATRRYKPGSTQPVAVGGPAREDVAEPIDSSLEEE